MQRIFRNGIRRSIATQSPLEIVNCCILTRSASSQISVQKKWPWNRQASPSTTTITLPPSNSPVRYYSIDSDDPLEQQQQIPNSERKIPKMSDKPVNFAAPPFSSLVMLYKAWKIRKYDAEFSMREFIEGSKKAVETVSDKLAMEDFDGLHGMVTDDLIDELREKLSTWTTQQRSQLRSQSEDMCRAFAHDIKMVEDDHHRLLVKISMIYHVVEGFQNLTEGKFDEHFSGKLNSQEFLRKSSEFLDENFQILNYTFSKEFSADSNDDWIISFINHANIHDEMMEHKKTIDETLRQMREKNQQKK